MASDFQEFMELTKKSVRLDPWIADRGMAGYVDEIIGEAEEVRAAIAKQDLQNLREELGDILMDWASLCVLAEQQGLLAVDEVIAGAMQKIRRRRPYLEENRRVTKEEARKIWLEVKSQEKRR
ncbi:MAG TPA: MazG nucleotide pyrophosphohydrolase domain-containing protein [Candidatus Nanoarchaeia archaeon]|nr:MazG nucleotide pyrophosphohydrolase domain-containing protein [Candidatus Nanoarchaeia archaeon]